MKKLPFKLPLKVTTNISFGEEEMYEIVDGDGNAIVETDGGYYRPTIEEAQCIVEAVNNYYA